MADQAQGEDANGRAEVAGAAPGASSTKAGSGDGLDRAARAGLPPDAGPEAEVLGVRPAMFGAHPFSFLALNLLILIGAILIVWKGLVSPTAWIAWTGVALVLGALITLGVWKILTFSTALRITNKRTIVRVGLLSRSTSEVLHDNIRNIQITQSFLERLLNVGRIGISSSGQDGIEIDVKNIPNPDRVRQIIDLYRPL